MNDQSLYLNENLFSLFYLLFIRPKGDANYNIVADIRLSARNAEILHHSGFKYCKRNGRAMENQKTTSWRCIKCLTKEKCGATASTKYVGNTLMMALINSEHTHDPDKSNN